MTDERRAVAALAGEEHDMVKSPLWVGHITCFRLTDGDSNYVTIEYIMAIILYLGWHVHCYTDYIFC